MWTEPRCGSEENMQRLQRNIGLLTVLAAVLLAAGGASAGFRWSHLHRKAAQGEDKYDCQAATFFGSPSHEEFVSVGSQKDGTLVAFGNAWGPHFPASPKPTILGKGMWYEVSPWSDEDKIDPVNPDQRPHGDYVNKAGMIVFYSPDLQTIRRVVKFDWSVATIGSAMVAKDDGLIIAGSCTKHFDDFVKSADAVNTVPCPENVFDRRGRRRVYGPYYYKNIRVSGDSYVAKLSPDGSRLLWVWIFKGHRSAPSSMSVDHENAVLINLRGMRRITADGKKISDFPFHPGRIGLLAVSPRDGKVVVGGDHNSGTGREPWRRPTLKLYGPDHKQRWEAYHWGPKLVGHDDYRLVSDSALKRAIFDDNNHLLLVGWSDGGNSVLTRAPHDLDKHVKNTGMGFSTWGAGVLSVSYFIRMNPDTFEVNGWTPWVAYVPKDNGVDKPNSVSVSELLALTDGAVAVRGGAATGLIQTPNSFVKLDKRTCLGYGGRYVTIFRPDLSNMRFSSYMPGLSPEGMCQAGDGLAVVSSAKQEDRRGNKPPAVRALQGKHAGGYTDGHIFILGPSKVGKGTDK